MRKTALKAAVISLISLIAALSLTIAAISLVSPKTMASLCDSAGLKTAAVYYYRADYERSSDFNKLAVLIDAADYADDDKTLAAYGEKFVLSDEFRFFCERKDESSAVGKISSYDYYCYLAVTALYNTGKYDKSVSLAYLKTESYTEKCPLKVAVMIAKANGNRQYAKAITETYENGEKDRIQDVDGSLKNDIEELKAKNIEKMV